MKTRHWLFLVGLVVLVAWTITGCSLLGVSIDSRISMFFSDLNGDRTKAYLNLDPNSTTYGTVGQTTTVWDSNFPVADEPFSYTITSTAPYSASGVSITISGLAASGGSYLFIFVNRGSTFDNYCISDIRSVAGSTTTSIFGLP
ncbi:MAG TPA: hypothetical protein VFH83_04290 [Spirochaetia bacterium]|nr:hypothetical protein [Spirochaetia bacterium]